MRQNGQGDMSPPLPAPVPVHRAVNLAVYEFKHPDSDTEGNQAVDHVTSCFCPISVSVALPPSLPPSRNTQTQTDVSLRLSFHIFLLFVCVIM